MVTISNAIAKMYSNCGSYQQNLAARKIAVVVLGLQQWPSLQSHVQLVVEAVNAAVPGSYTEIDLPL